jgi:cell division protein FtsB
MIRNADIPCRHVVSTRGRCAKRTIPVEFLGLVYFLVIVSTGLLLVWQPARIAVTNNDALQLQAQLKVLKIRNEALKKTVAAMESLNYVESEARNRLGMVEPQQVRSVAMTVLETPAQIMAANPEKQERTGILHALSRIVEIFENKEVWAGGNSQ